MKCVPFCWLFTFDVAILATEDAKTPTTSHIPIQQGDMQKRSFSASSSATSTCCCSPPPQCCWENTSLIFPSLTEVQTNDINWTNPQKNGVPKAVHTVFQACENSAVLGLAKMTSVCSYCQRGEKPICKSGLTTWETLATSTPSHQASWWPTARLTVFQKNPSVMGSLKVFYPNNSRSF